MVVFETSAGSDLFTLTNAGVGTFASDLVVSGGDITGTGDESIDIGEATSDAITFLIDAAGEVRLTAGALSPNVSDGNALGTSSLMWSDLFLASGAVLNFNAGDVTLTHAADALTIAGGAVTISGSADGTDALTLTAGDILLTDGDLDLSGGDFNVVLDTADEVDITKTSAAAATEEGIDLTFTAGAGDGSDIYSGFRITATSANHSASTDKLYGINIANLASADTEGAESAIFVGTGWDDILNYNGTTVINGTGQVISTGITGTLFTLSGDTGTDEAIAQGNTLEVAGGTNGIDTVISATDTVTLNFDSTEVGTTTWGSGSAITWTFDASGGTDTTTAYGDNLIAFTSASTTFSGDITVTGGDVTGANGESLDIGEAANGTISLNIDGTSGLNVGSTGISSIGNVAHTIVNSGGALAIDSNSTGAINIGTGASAKTITIGNATGATALAFNSGTGSQTFTSLVESGTTTTSAFVFDAAEIKGGTGMYVTADELTTGKLAQFATTGNTLTTGTLVDIRSTATSLTGTAGIGSLANLDWSPGSAGAFGGLLSGNGNWI